MKIFSSSVSVILVFCGLQSLALAQTCSKHSPPHTVALLELYTSEGCSSCPPADKFVSGLRKAGLTAEQVVPLSMHVDYWDYIGWKDPFANRAFTERQRWLSNLAGSRTIYTPEIFVVGRELRSGLLGWSGGLEERVKRINATRAPVDISISLGKLVDGSLPVSVEAKLALNSGSSTKQALLYVALTESGVVSNVKAGENNGVVLKHDYVVRQWLGPYALNVDDGAGRAAFSHTIIMPAGSSNRQFGVTAFVQGENGEILQTLALPICS